MELNQLTQAALALSESERIEMAASLIGSLDDNHDADADALWAAQVERRVAALDDGTAKLVPANLVTDEMKRRRNG